MRNEYRQVNKETIAVFLFNGEGEKVAETLVDAEDKPLIASHRWYLLSSGYVATRYKKGRPWGTRMHRLLLSEPLRKADSDEVDHINRDKLDNRKSNLRIVDRYENAQNVSRGNQYSQYRDVTYRKTGYGRPWIAQVGFDGTVKYLGGYDTEKEAADAAIEFRRCNLPETVERESA